MFRSGFGVQGQRGASSAWGVQRQLRHLRTTGRVLVQGGGCEGEGARAFTSLLSPQFSSHCEKAPSLPSASTLRGHGRPAVWSEQPDVSDHAPAPGDTRKDALGRAEAWPCSGWLRGLAEGLVAPCAGVGRRCPHRGQTRTRSRGSVATKGWSGRAWAPVQQEAATSCGTGGVFP